MVPWYNTEGASDKKQIDKLDFNNIKNTYDTMKKVKTTHKMEKKNANHVFGNRLVSRIHIKNY